MSLPDKRITGFIRRHHVLTITACDEQGLWCANIFYAYIADRNLFVYTTDPATRHGKAAAASGQVAASIVLETRVVGRVQGLQISGRTRLVDAADGDAPRRAYLKRFPYAAAAKLDLWILEPTHMKLTDNTLGFGKKLIWQCDEGA